MVRVEASADEVLSGAADAKMIFSRWWRDSLPIVGNSGKYSRRSRSPVA
jgi:hypothetical protein